MQNIERDNNVKYELYSKYLGSQFIQEPSGWSNDRESYERDTDRRASWSKIDVELEFYGDASTYLRDIYYTRGVQEVVQLIKYEKNKYTLEEEWYVKYVQQLDIHTDCILRCPYRLLLRSWDRSSHIQPYVQTWLFLSLHCLNWFETLLCIKLKRDLHPWNIRGCA